MSVWGFVEKLKLGAPKTARQFAGFPVELEWKQLSASEDERIMADGRPAYAWYAELEMLRKREPDLQKIEVEIREKFTVLRIVEWAYARNILDETTLLRIKRLPITKDDPRREFLENLDKYVERIEPEPRS